jgi:hypothetical protein
MATRSLEWDAWREAKIRSAKVKSDLATARLQGMKLRVTLTPPQPTSGTFPFGHARTCAEWRPFETWQERRNP